MKVVPELVPLAIPAVLQEIGETYLFIARRQQQLGFFSAPKIEEKQLPANFSNALKEAADIIDNPDSSLQDAELFSKKINEIVGQKRKRLRPQEPVPSIHSVTSPIDVN